jgi:signal transduction histidine kinase
MVAAVFRARARTIDHLGREQIADCPTAISELWKNAYDAYATAVALHIFDGKPPVAVIADDGHGMHAEDFVEKWLVVGTESKAGSSKTPERDRNGLPPRPRQGQKGIGRLSSAFLGPLLLVLSKRRDAPLAAALIDWRLFENPYLYLEDIELPVLELDAKEQVLAQLPAMFETLRGNLMGSGTDRERDARIVEAWERLSQEQAEASKSSTKQAIEAVLESAPFSERHLHQWPFWRGDADHGTVLLIADIGFDLTANFESWYPADDAAKDARVQLFGTLSSFTDPYADERDLGTGYGAGRFGYSVTAWEGALRRAVIVPEREFDLRNLEELEHVVDGEVDEHGVFNGRIKAFGSWLEGPVRIEPKGQVKTRTVSRVGPFRLRLGSFQQVVSASSHPPLVHEHLTKQAKRYAGVMVYRNGLRVMPYGREDNDFFEIEERRSKHAGRYFWSNRRTFGRVAITRDGNPNLRDKAGREGLIDNEAAKGFRALVINILEKTGRDYFGTDSDFQKTHLPVIKAHRAEQRAAEARDQQRTLRRQQFRADLRRHAPELAAILGEADRVADRVRALDAAATTKDILPLRDAQRRLHDRLRGCTLRDVPQTLGSLEKEYSQFRHNQRHAEELLATLDRSLSEALDARKPDSPGDIARRDLEAHAAFLQDRLRDWHREALALLDAERGRVTDLYEARDRAYHGRALPLLEELAAQRMPLARTLARLTEEREHVDLDNADVFEPYLGALRSLRESIDLQALANQGTDQLDDLRQQLERLHALAQLGITVEIIGHEIEGFELSISQGLKEFPAEVRSTAAFGAVRTAHEALADRLRFLSPLKLSGPTFRTTLSGAAIFDYVTRFFGDRLGGDGPSLEATPRFLAFSVYEQPARVFPVFTNLVNNSLYWVRQQGGAPGHILFDAVAGRVAVADDGPGVEPDDLKHLFTLFFTRKVRGGRGVGLYLCRANLAAGGHTIEYATEEPYRILPGASFVIDFKGARYDGPAAEL